MVVVNVIKYVCPRLVCGFILVRNENKLNRIKKKMGTIHVNLVPLSQCQWTTQLNNVTANHTCILMSVLGHVRDMYNGPMAVLMIVEPGATVN